MPRCRRFGRRPWRRSRERSDLPPSLSSLIKPSALPGVCAQSWPFLCHVLLPVLLFPCVNASSFADAGDAEAAHVGEELIEHLVRPRLEDQPHVTRGELGFADVLALQIRFRERRGFLEQLVRFTEYIRRDRK